jgi:transposase
MGYKRKIFNQLPFDEKLYQTYFHRYQAEYIRIKLRSVHLYHKGEEFVSISKSLGIHIQSVRKYVNDYIQGSFELLCQSTIRPQESLLSVAQSEDFKRILLSKSPAEAGLEGNIWTGAIMCQYLKKTYNIEYKSGIYDLLERLNLSHQKAHSDYGNADPNQQIAFMSELKQTLLAADATTAVLKFDEFSVCERPTSYYGWAEKNTRPTVTTNEKKDKERGNLCQWTFSGRFI